MKTQAQLGKTSAVILLTLVSSASSFAAQPASGNRRTAAPRSAPAQQSQQAEPAQPQQLAPPTNETTIRPATSDTDEAGTLPDRIDVQSMKRRYWTVGNEDLMDVVQNRLYTKKGRMEASLRYGFWSDDPFIDHKTIGFSVGYHLNEFWSIHTFYSSISSSNSQAYTAAQELNGLEPRVNPGKAVYGAEARASLIYGKLSLLGNAIVYYDLNVAAGLSQHKATVGSSTGYFAGLGQQFYLNKSIFLSLDYRLLLHTDSFPSATQPTRALTTNWIQLGVGVFAF